MKYTKWAMAIAAIFLLLILGWNLSDGGTPNFTKHRSIELKIREELGLQGAARELTDADFQKITEFSYGVSDRGASIRIPVYTVEHDWNGYLEDRRPASNADPYKILAHIVGTLTK